MTSKEELNANLLAAYTSDFIDYERVETLLKQGAEPLGRIVGYFGQNNLHDGVVDHLFRNDDTLEDLYQNWGNSFSSPLI